jgi:cobaltochelatase CobT
MRGRPITIAAMAADLVAQALERCGIACEVLGFTTRAWKGGRPHAAWVADGRPPRPGRLNELRHIVYKAASVPWRRARLALGVMLEPNLLKENIDGEALQWAQARLLARPEQRKLLIVVSDGAPVDQATLLANDKAILDRHLREVIARIETGGLIELAAIGIRHDVTAYYRRAVTVADEAELGRVLVDQLGSLLVPSGGGRRRRWSAVRSPAR